jgi:hypothetical protein
MVNSYCFNVPKTVGFNTSFFVSALGVNALEINTPFMHSLITIMIEFLPLQILLSVTSSQYNPGAAVTIEGVTALAENRSFVLKEVFKVQLLLYGALTFFCLQ